MNAVITVLGKDRCDNRCIKMLTELLVGATVYSVTGYTDMRKGIDGLAQIVEGSVGKDAYSKAVYLFCGRSSTKMKALVWDGDGFLLLYKRLDTRKSTFFKRKIMMILDESSRQSNIIFDNAFLEPVSDL